MYARAGIWFFLLPGVLGAQAMVETALGTGRAATMSAPAAKAGEAIGKTMEHLSSTLDAKGDAKGEAKGEAKDSAPAPPAGSAKRTALAKKSTPAKGAPKGKRGAAENAVTTPVSEVRFENPSGIEKGMEYAEILRRFGPPSLKLTTGVEEEVLSYAPQGGTAAKGGTVSVTMRRGKATAVGKAGS